MKAASVSKKPLVRKVRCAVYTRKSSEEGLDMEFNSLDAQREACEAYIASQRHEGWVLVPDRYDDGGVSGATLERPALKRLLADIEHGLVDVVVVYKIDRLSRSLMDFAKLVDVFDANDVTFVSVTQSFNTTTSMGRLTLNILLSFAQFEREVIGERIRDKFAASRKRGMWMGGWARLGYEVRDRKLVIVEDEAATVRMIFERFTKVGSATRLVAELTRQSLVNKRGKPIDKSLLYKLLNNRVYVGDAVHKGESHPGEHEASVAKSMGQGSCDPARESEKAREQNAGADPSAAEGADLRTNGTCHGADAHSERWAAVPLLCVHCHSEKQPRDACPIGRVPAGDIETAVIGQIRGLLVWPEIVAATWKACRAEDAVIAEASVRDALHRFNDLWDELFPAEQARVVQLLVERIDLTETGMDLRLRTDGTKGLVQDLSAKAQAVSGAGTGEIRRAA